MIYLQDLFPLPDLDAMLTAGYVREQRHPHLPLRILNYTAKAAYDSVWNNVTMRCRGLIFEESSLRVVARPFPKFFNYGQPEAGELDLNAGAVVTDKLDGSLGILYPGDHGYQIATRGSFTSEQALHATEVFQERYADWQPDDDLTYLFEIIYPENRVVLDYGDLDDVVMLTAVETDTGRLRIPHGWPGDWVQVHVWATLGDALQAPPRPNAEGYVVYIPRTGAMVKLKQDDYVALHRIMTGTNARHVWEVAAVQACYLLIREPKHWASYLGIDPARAEEVLALGDDWLAGVPDEFYEWIQDVIETAQDQVIGITEEATRLVGVAAGITDRRERFESLADNPLQKEIMRLASIGDAEAKFPDDGWARVLMKAWKLARPEPTQPFARSEDVA